MAGYANANELGDTALPASTGWQLEAVGAGSCGLYTVSVHRQRLVEWSAELARRPRDYDRMQLSAYAIWPHSWGVGHYYIHPEARGPDGRGGWRR